MALTHICSDFLQFQETLKKMRDLDDKIIYTLNTLPTESFRGQVNSEAICKDIYNRLLSQYSEREEAIKNCIVLSANKVKALRDKRDANANDPTVDKRFKLEQRKLRLLQAELNVEDIVKQRSLKAFSERCRNYVNVGNTL